MTSSSSQDLLGRDQSKNHEETTSQFMCDVPSDPNTRSSCSLLGDCNQGMRVGVLQESR